MKIAVVHQRYAAIGGAERYLNALVAEVARRGHEIHIFANRWEETTAQQSVLFHRVPMLRAPSVARLLSFAFCAKRAIDRLPCDLVFSMDRTLRQDVFRAAGGCHREWLAQRRRHLAAPKRVLLHLNPFHAAMLWLEKRIYSADNTRAVIALSHRGKREIIQHYNFPADRIHVVHLGVDCERFCPATHQRGGEEFVLLFVGTGFERKGLAFCVQVLASLPPHVRLHVIGKGNRRLYERLAGKLGVGSRLRFLGTTSDMPSAYRSADLLLHPAIYEPFGNVCLEAMACGLPVITSQTTGASEIVVSGSNGAVVDDPVDIQALAGAIRPFLDRRFLAEASVRARQTAESLPFSRNVEKTLEVIRLAASRTHAQNNAL